jgi:hypothetical protein
MRRSHVTDFDPAVDPRCVRPAELDRLLADLRRVLTAVEACHQWRPWLGDWRDRLTDAASVDGNVNPDREEQAERFSGISDVQGAALRLCVALEATFGCGGIDSAGDDFPIYPKA